MNKQTNEEEGNTLKNDVYMSVGNILEMNSFPDAVDPSLTILCKVSVKRGCPIRSLRDAYPAGFRCLLPHLNSLFQQRPDNELLV